MAKVVSNTVLDEALNYVKNNTNKITVCAGQPAAYSSAVTPLSSSGNALADVLVSSADFTGPVDGDASGRKITVGAQSSVSVDSTGSADHVALVDTSSTGELLYVTTCTTQTLTAGNTVNTGAFDIEIRDPS